MPAAAKDCSVVVLLHDSGDVVASCLASIPAECEVVVVDNASHDDGLEIARRARPDAVVVALATNGGFAVGCNAGVAGTSRPVVVLLNPDARLEPGALAAMREALARAPGAIVGPALLHDDGSPHHALRRPSRPLHEALELLPLAGRLIPPTRARNLLPTAPQHIRGGRVPYLQGACLMLARTTWDELGGLDEDFFLYSEEETLAWRAWQAGHPSLYVPEAEVRHTWGTSAAKHSRLAARHFYRSRALFYRKRDGELRGSLSAGVIGAALLLALVLRPLLRAASAGTSRPTRWYLDALGGLAQGVAARRSS